MWTREGADVATSLMTSESAAVIFRAFAVTLHVDLRRDLERAAIAYAHFRAHWALATTEERRDMDAARTAAHESSIDASNIPSRAMARSGEDASWRDAVGHDRKLIGDFACHLHCLIALSAR